MRRLAILFSILLLSPLTAQNLIRNGSFELPGGLAPGGVLYLGTGNTNLTDWIVGGPDASFVVLINGTHVAAGGCLDFGPLDGKYHLVFNGGDTPPGKWIAQTFDTIPGVQYEVSFYVGRVCVGAGVMSLTASVRSQTGDMLGSTVAIASSHGYGSRQSFVFTASTTNTTLQFLDSSAATYSVDITLDDVAVSFLRPDFTTQDLNIQLTNHASQVAISWLGMSNRIYQVQSRTELTTNTWMNSGSPVLGTEGINCLFDSILDQPQKFYRLINFPLYIE